MIHAIQRIKHTCQVADLLKTTVTSYYSSVTPRQMCTLLIGSIETYTTSQMPHTDAVHDTGSVAKQSCKAVLTGRDTGCHDGGNTEADVHDAVSSGSTNLAQSLGCLSTICYLLLCTRNFSLPDCKPHTEQRRECD